MAWSLLGSSVYGISQVRILEWVAISFSRVSFWPRDWTHISCLAGGFFTTEPPGKSQLLCLGETKTLTWLVFFVCVILLYCHDLEPNPRHLWGLHLLGSTVLNLGKSGLLFFQVFFFFLFLPSPVYIIFFGTPLPFRLATWFVSQFFVFVFYFPVFFSPMFYFG